MRVCENCRETKPIQRFFQDPEKRTFYRECRDCRLADPAAYAAAVLDALNASDATAVPA